MKDLLIAIGIGVAAIALIVLIMPPLMALVIAPWFDYWSTP